MTQLTELRNQNQSFANNQLDSPQDANIQQTQQSIDVWGIVWRRKWLIIVFAIVGVGLGYIYMLQATPIYESSAQILIENRKPPAIPISGVDMHYGSSSEESKHAVVITSPHILAQAFENYNLKKMSTFRDDPQPLVSLTNSLVVQIVEEGTNVLQVSVRGPNPDETQKTVDSIVRSYQSFLEMTYKDTGKETRQLIVKAKDELMEKWQTLVSDYRDFKKTTPLMYRGQDVVNMHAERQSDYELERVKLQKQLTDLSSLISAVANALKSSDGVESVLILAKQQGVQLQDGLSYRESLQRDRYLELLLQEEDLMSRLGKDHPDVTTVQRQLRTFEKMFPSMTEQGKPDQKEKQLLVLVTNYLSSLKQRQFQLQSQYDKLSELFGQEEQAARELQGFQAQDEQFRSEIERTQQLFNVVVKSLEQISLVSDYDGYTYQILANPAVGVKVSPLLVRVLPISAVLGMIAGFGLAYLVDVADNAFRTPDEVGQVMQLPVIGHIPLMDTAAIQTLPGCDIDPVMCTVHAPKSPQSEAYRAVRTALYFNSRGSKHHVLQVTSPMPGDGKSTLSSNLAVTIAQSGKSVLLLDADFRRPTQHKVFDIDDPDVGLASVVAGDADPGDAWCDVPQVPNLRVMACGPRPDNPSELLSSEEFANVLELLREQFDFVIVDTPPVLAVSDPCAVAARVDGVILTFRIHKRARPLAVRAREALTSTAAEVIGVVVNGVDQGAGGYYSQYSYGNAGYRYAYNYSEGYGSYGSESSENNAIKEYFTDESARNSREELESRG